MLNAKIFELRDRGTLIPWVAIKIAYPMSDRERALWRRAGYGDQPEESDCIIQGPAHCSGGNDNERLIYNASYIANSRTRMAAHFIGQNFDALESGGLIDIRYLLEETDKPAQTEINEPENPSAGA